MKDWLNEGVLKNFQEVQERLWEQLSGSIPSLTSSSDLGFWRKAYEQSVDHWERVVEQTLGVQAAWLEQWKTRGLSESQMPEVAREWSRQMQEIMENWVQVQKQFWDEMFTMMRNQGEAIAEGDKAAQVAKLATVHVPIVERSAPVKSATPVKAAAKSASTEPSAKSAAGQARQMDDLTLLPGIGPAIARKFLEQGISSFEQLADLPDEAIKDIETRVLKSSGRFERYGWVAKAREQLQKK